MPIFQASHPWSARALYPVLDPLFFSRRTGASTPSAPDTDTGSKGPMRINTSPPIRRNVIGSSARCIVNHNPFSLSSDNQICSLAFPASFSLSSCESHNYPKSRHFPNPNHNNYSTPPPDSNLQFKLLTHHHHALLQHRRFWRRPLRSRSHR